jgi:lipopolysaccharide transport system ATP-binding protein
MKDTVIEIKNISKKYRLGEISSGLLYKDLSRIWIRIKNFFFLKRANIDSYESKDEFIYALKDINITVKKGEVLGLIGSNGAGKSTLLKILSKITSPTSGEINIKGSIASLLEVGTGFHPELTGRENIYLSGAILGMNKKKIKENLEEIINFSGMKDFIDTPIKRYSSGMKVRLGFSVAAYLTADILLIDEVLAVGDAQFQEKCLRKIEKISENGRTVIFVSHNMMAITKNCTRVILFKKGKIEYEGDTKKAVEKYLTTGLPLNNNKKFRNLGNNKSTSITDINFYYKEKNIYVKSKTLPVGSKLKINIKLEDQKIIKRDLLFNFEIYSMNGYPLTTFGNEFNLEKASYDGINKKYSYNFIIKEILLMPGKYMINMYVKDYLYGELCYIKNLTQLKIIESDIYDSGKLPNKGIQGLFITRSKLEKEI